MRTVDLHSHSTASDGMHPPEEVVRRAAAAGVGVLALTDHDTLDGLAAARVEAESLGVRLVPGVEVSCDLNGRDTHILGLFIDPEGPALVRLLEAAREERIRAADRVLRRLSDCHVPVTMEAVLAQAQGQTLGRPHFARALREAGHVRSIQEAFDRFLGEGRPACVWRQRPPIPDACAAITGAGGVAVLAHPGAYHPTAMGRDVISRLRLEGLAGVEAYHPGHGAAAARQYHRIAESLGLGVSGGSDFHGHPGDRLGVSGLDEDGLAALEALRPGQAPRSSRRGGPPTLP